MEENISDEDAISEYVQYLIDEGGLILESVTEEGEPIYRHNMEVLERIAPEYAAMHLREIEDTLLELYSKNLVDIEITDDGEVVYKLAEGIKTEWLK